MLQILKTKVPSYQNRKDLRAEILSRESIRKKRRKHIYVIKKRVYSMFGLDGSNEWFQKVQQLQVSFNINQVL